MNLDLTRMLGAPIAWTCSHCGRPNRTGWEDKDSDVLDDSDANHAPGKWRLETECYNCGQPFVWVGAFKGKVA